MLCGFLFSFGVTHCRFLQHLGPDAAVEHETPDDGIPRLETSEAFHLLLSRVPVLGGRVNIGQHLPDRFAFVLVGFGVSDVA